MEKGWIIYVFFIISGYVFIAEATQHCEILQAYNTRCVYTVSCEVYAGSVENPNCDYNEPIVTFKMNNSRVGKLHSGFFSATNFDSKVRSIVAMRNLWTIISPEAFKFFFNTIRLDLSNNTINEIQPEAFLKLFKLNYLNLSSNFIERLNSKSLVTTINSGDSQLHIIDLSNNILTTIENKPFEQCTHLEELYLQNNKIATLEDDVFTNLKNLTRLYIQGNSLTGLNMTLINLKSLKELDLSHNKIGNLSGFEMNRLISLERVNMSFNKIEFIESNCFNQAFNLQILDLKCNNIKSNIDNIMFINNGKLAYLDLFNNNITNIAENAFQHNTLFYLNVEKNFISGVITKATLAGLEYVKSLNFFKQNITSIKNNAFNLMTSLTNLNMSYNNIDAIDSTSFINASALAILDLSHNNISSLFFFKNALTSLTELYLNNNRLKSIPGNTFTEQILLKKLDISMNRITTIDQYSLPLQNLQYLNITGNLVGVIKSNVLSPAKYLRYLDLSSLNISRIDDMAINNLPVLARLNMSNNAIEYIGPKNFLNLNNMFSLDLSYNKLSKLELNNTMMPNLTALYLNNNKITNMTRVLPNSTQIMYLDISNNKITEISVSASESLKSLRVLYVSNNQIIKFNNPQVNDLSQLYNLDLSSNQISTIDLSYFSNLVSLDISNNTFSYINSTLFQNLNYLQSLDLSKNNITTLPPGIFQELKILKLLNISSNNLSELRYGSLRGLHRTEVIDISRNKIAEIDVDIFHECTELTRLIIDYNRIKVLDVEQLINVVPKLTSLSIGGNPVSCKQIVRDIKRINNTGVRSVEVTSIHKIYHEDNVNGIKCGDIIVTTLAPLSTAVVPAEISSSSTLVIWCSVLTVLVVLLTGAFLVYKRNNSSGTYSQARMHLGRSVELTGSDFQNDLLN